tara:strand:- start:42 stop:311 length:270 start_codon:yes stop_codon:yes gene_type:complete
MAKGKITENYHKVMTDIYKITYTGKTESWGKGLVNTGGDMTYLIPTDEYLIADPTDFDPKKMVNSTVTLTKITEAKELKAAKTAINFDG